MTFIPATKIWFWLVGFQIFDFTEAAMPQFYISECPKSVTVSRRMIYRVANPAQN
jgi:hypothetical protein